MATSNSISWSHYAFMQPELVFCLRCGHSMGIRASDRAGTIDPLCTQCHINPPQPNYIHRNWLEPHWSQIVKKAGKP